MTISGRLATPQATSQPHLSTAASLRNRGNRCERMPPYEVARGRIHGKDALACRPCFHKRPFNFHNGWLGSCGGQSSAQLARLSASKQPSSEAGALTPSSEELADVAMACNRLWELDRNRLVPGTHYRLDLQEGKKCESFQPHLLSLVAHISALSLVNVVRMGCGGTYHSCIRQECVLWSSDKCRHDGGSMARYIHQIFLGHLG